MAIVRTKPFFIIGTTDCKEQFVCELQKFGCVELQSNVCNAKFLNEINCLNAQISEVDSAILRLKKFSKVRKSIFSFKKLVSFSNLENISSKSNHLLKIVRRVNWCCEKIETNLMKISELEQKINELVPYLNFNFCLNKHETRFTRFLVGYCPRRFSENDLKAKFGNNIYFEIINSSKLQTVLFVVALKNDFKKAEKVLSNLKFSAFSFDDEKSLTAQQYFNLFNSELEKLSLQNNELEQEIKSNAGYLTDFEMLFDYFKLNLDQKQKLANLTIKKSVFFLEGYLNPQFEDEFKNLAKSFNIYYEIEKATDSSPIDFENSSFVSAVENITKTYSMPSKFDVDPNPAMAFFYYLFFGMMFSDAGYGLIMAAFCSIFAFFKKVDLETKKKFRMFFWCGVSTTFWGFMFGSFFGNFVETASKSFFGLNFSLPPIFLDGLSEPMKLLGFSLFLGLVQVFVGVFIGFVAMLKFKNFKQAFFVKFSWLLILFGSGLFFVQIAIFKLLGLCFSAVGVFMVLVFSGYESKGFFKKILTGVVNLYGATSYVGDILSYCRLMALSIATGVVANVVNLLSAMMCVNFFGFCAFLIVFVFGHLMNFGINALGAYVHTIRLQYVEFFSKFYEGGGRKFLPYGLGVTKYFEFEVDLTKIK